MLAKLNSCGIIALKTEENVRIPLRLHNMSRFPRAGFPLLYLLLFLHSHGKGRPEGRPFLVRTMANMIKWHQTYFDGSKLPVNQEGAECHEYFWSIVPDDCFCNSHCNDVEIIVFLTWKKPPDSQAGFSVSGRPFSPLFFWEAPGACTRWGTPTICVYYSIATQVMAMLFVWNGRESTPS